MTELVPSLVVRQLLIDLGLATDGAIFIAEMPDKPDDCSMLLDYCGSIYRTMRRGTTYRHGVRIRLRATTFPEGSRQINAIVAALAGVLDRPVTVDGSTHIIQAFTKIDSPLSRGQERTSSRYIFTSWAQVKFREAE